MTAEVVGQNTIYYINNTLKRLIMTSRFFRILILLTILDPAVIYAQQKVTGTVSDDSGVLSGVVVILKDAPVTTGVTTDINGTYSIEVPDENAVLEFQCLGYKDCSEMVGRRSVINVKMKEENVLLDEVVFVGFGTQKKINLTGSVAEADMEEVLGERPVASVGAALQGAIPGLTVSGGLGPNSNMSLNIRGFTSTTGGSPLVLIDNVEASLDMIDPQDIETVTVLKDAASASIYGARASYGVVLITTKKGGRNQPFSISYNNNFGFSRPTTLPELADNISFLRAWGEKNGTDHYSTQDQDISRWIEYIELFNKYPDAPMFSNMYESGAWKDPDSPDSKPVYFYLKPVNQASELYKTGFSQTHTVSASGGSDRINYRMSAGYYSNNGILIMDKEKYRRINASSYINASITKWLEQSLDIKLTSSKITVPQNTNINFKRFYGGAANMCPAGDIPTYDSNGNVTLYPNAESIFSRLQYSTPKTTEKIYPRLFSRTRITPVKGLEINFEYTFSYTGTDITSYDKPVMYGRTQGAMTMLSPVDSKYYQRVSENRYNAINAYASYSRSVKNHNFKILAGYNQEWEKNIWTEMTAVGLTNPDKPSFATSTGISSDGSFIAPVITDSWGEYAIIGSFLRINYDYKGKYLIELNGRYDGSSKFPSGNRFGFFPSASIGWNITKENFMKSIKVLDILKLRASYGSIGNQNIGNYTYYSTVTQDQGYNTDINWYDVNSGMYPNTIKDAPNLIRSNFTWETVTTVDIGLDFEMFENRLYGTFDLYRRTTSGMLTPGLQLPAVIGASSPTQNSATAVTDGWELTIGYKGKSKDFSYGISFNIFDSMARITKFNNPSKLFDNYYEGQVIGEIWGYVTDGFYTADDFIDPTNPSAGLKPGVVSFKGNNNIMPGDIKYKQIDNAERNPNFVEGEISGGNDSALNPGDRKIIGYDVDRYCFGVNGNFSYKGINLSFILQGVGHHDVWLPNTFPLQSAGLRSDQLNYWRPVNAGAGNYEASNPDAEFPRIYGTGNSMNYNIQTKYLANAAYLRVKNISLSYSIPDTILEKIRIRSLKVFASFENPFTITSLPKGYDPENVSLGNIYQVFKTYSFGINLSF